MWRVLDLSASVFGYNLTGIYLGVEGLEPSRPIDQQILSLLCLPFHHTPIVFKATPRFELGIEDLQSTALPLGHIALAFYYKIILQIVISKGDFAKG